jgi:NitT/TauT family transport system substrate-binding protein
MARTASVAGAAGLVGLPKPLRAEPPPETSTVRLGKFFPSSCEAPQYIARELLAAEGFSDIRYVEGDYSLDSSVWIARGELDFDWNYAPTYIKSIEAGVPIVVLAGLHSGCLELIARDGIDTVTDLKGKSVGVYSQSSNPHVLLMLMAAYVGLDPVNDIDWVMNAEIPPMQLFIDGKIDAFLALPPEPQQLRARKIGKTVLATAVDHPWAQYYCCMLAGASDYVSRYPVATKRVMRALLKAVDICANDPKLAAQMLIDGQYTDQYDIALETFGDLRYDRWRDFDPEDTLRFYALRMHETGLIKASPQQIIAAGTDWRFLKEIERELKT